MKTQTELLKEPITILPLSAELKVKLSAKGYTNLQHILEQKLSHLRNNEGLTLHDELELFNLVTKNGLEKMWREE